MVKASWGRCRELCDKVLHQLLQAQSSVPLFVDHTSRTEPSYRQSKAFGLDRSILTLLSSADWLKTATVWSPQRVLMKEIFLFKERKIL